NQQALAAVGVYAALCTIIIFWLANETGKVRRKERIALGDGGDKHLSRLMRGMANNTEYVPLFLIKLLAAALIGMPVWLVHLFGAPFVLGRVIHASYFVYPGTPIMRRFIGFGIAFLAQGLLLLGLLAHGLWLSFGG
ncbi:MAG: MAPEG family protein, partial [Pseudomonadota bacterium]